MNINYTQKRVRHSILVFPVSLILDLYDFSPNGIFSLLEDEGKLRESCVEKFTSKVCSCWERHQKFSKLSRSTCKPIQLPELGFTIRHFATDVPYSTVGLDSFCDMYYISIVYLSTFGLFLKGGFYPKKLRLCASFYSRASRKCCTKDQKNGNSD